MFNSPQFFRIDRPKIDISLIWGYFDYWKEGRDYIFLCKSNNPKTLKPKMNNAEFESWKKADMDYNKYVNNSEIVPSYVQIDSKIHELYVFKRIR